MIGKIIGISISIFSTLVTSTATAQGTLGSDPEYKEMLEQLNRSYEGFFIHENEQKRWERNRRSGVADAKKKRDAYEAQREAARRNFVRTPPPNMEPLRIKWEAEQARLEREREQIRKSYVKKKNEIEKVKNSARKIPANRELGLDE